MSSESAPSASQDAPPVESDTHDGPPNRRRKTWLRLALLGVFLVVTYVIAEVTGLRASLDGERIRSLMEAAGALGVVAFALIFAFGELLHVPGWVFVGAATVAYGTASAMLVSYLGAMTSVTISFFVVRAIGGQPLGEVKRGWMRRVLAGLDARPVRTIALLRLVLWMAPPLNYALAMSSVRFRDYAIGSAVGLVLPVIGVVVFFEWLVALV